MGKLSKPAEDMFYASVIGNLEMLKRSVAEGSDINEADDDGSTPLMLAAVNGQSEAAKFLLDSGADPSKKDVDGWDAAKLARNAGYEDVAKMIESHSGEPVGYPEGLEEMAIVAFVNEKAKDIKEKLEGIKANSGADEREIAEANNLNILLFAEANSFSKHIDEEVKGTINGALGYLNEDFSKASNAIGRPVDKVYVTNIKDYNISKLLDEDERLLKDITKGIYNSIVSFVSDELNMRPSEFAIKYGAYHKRLMQMRDALLDSLRTIGTEGKKGDKMVAAANIIGARPQ